MKSKILNVFALAGLVVFSLGSIKSAVSAQSPTPSPLRCTLRMFQVDADYQLPYRYDRTQITDTSWVNPGDYYVYAFDVRSSSQLQKYLTSFRFQQVSNGNEPIEIVSHTVPNGSCRNNAGDKSLDCTLSYSFYESATDPAYVKVKIIGGQSRTTTSSMFSLVTSEGRTSCANWLQIKEANPTPQVPFVYKNNPITWSTPNALFHSDNFHIRIGKTVYDSLDPVAIHSDPSNTKTTLEAMWNENGTEMRFYLYFRKIPDNMWELYQIRTYNGANPGDWIYWRDSLYNGITSLVGHRNYSASRTFIPDGSSQDAQITCDGCEFNAFLSGVTQITPTPSQAIILSPDQEELLRVKRDLEQVKTQLSEQKQQVSALQTLVSSLRDFIQRFFGRFFTP